MHIEKDVIYNITNDSTDSSKNGTLSEDMETYEIIELTNVTDSDDTEIYELSEQTIGTVMILDEKAAKLHIKDCRTPFRCLEKNCDIRLKTERHKLSLYGNTQDAYGM